MLWNGIYLDYLGRRWRHRRYSCGGVLQSKTTTIDTSILHRLFTWNGNSCMTCDKAGNWGERLLGVSDLLAFGDFMYLMVHMSNQ